MPLIDVRLKPGQWQIERRGVSGARYRLRFQGSAFMWISRLEEWKPMPGKPLWWRRIYTALARNKHPTSALTLNAFADLGYKRRTQVAEFIVGQHARLRGVDEELPRQ